jgi:type IV pilus assembly protein PilP
MKWRCLIPAILAVAFAASTAVASTLPHPLERFELDTLVISSVADTDCGPVAFIVDPDGYQHTVRPGDQLGKHFGRIRSIAPGKIVIVEIFQGVDGEWAEVERTLVPVH